MKQKIMFHGEFSLLINEAETYCFNFGERENLLMEEDKIPVSNLLELSNYLANLFINCEEQFECPPVKIQKLILIMQIYYRNKYKKNCANDLEYIAYAPCGFKIPDVAYYIPSIINNSSHNSNSAIILSYEQKEKLLNCSNSANPLFDAKYLDISIRELLLNIFVAFGGYTANDLGCFLNGLKPEDKTLEYGKISIWDFNRWIDENYDKLHRNIRDFIE